MLVDSEFDTPSMFPWKPIRGEGWRSGSGALNSVANSRVRTQSVRAVAADIVQKEAVTMETNLVLNTSNTYNLSFFAADKTVPTPRTCISVSIARTRASVIVMRQGSSTSFGAANIAVRQGMEAKVLCSYDPLTGRIRAWINGRPLCDKVMPAPFLKTGNSVVFSSSGYYGVTISSLRLHRGLVAPTGRIDRADPNNDSVFIDNGDRYTAKSLSATKGKLHVEMAIGALDIDMAKVKRILFKTKGRTAAQVGDVNVTVRTAGSRLALKVTGMTADEIVGVSPVLGEVKLARSVLKELVFIVPE
jgi:hypothetical protein